MPEYLNCHQAISILKSSLLPEACACFCSMKEVFIGIGIELGYLIGLPCVSVIGGWRIVFGVALLFALIMKTGMVCTPPTSLSNSPMV